MFEEFKKFAIKGNVMDLAIGVIIGAAFGKIVSSLVSDVIMPLIGIITGGVDFSDKAIILREATEGISEITLNYGLFINTIINFTIIAFSIFIVVRQFNKFSKKEKKKDKKPTEEVVILTEIRDLLKK